MAWKDDEGLAKDLKNYLAQNLKRSEILSPNVTMMNTDGVYQLFVKITLILF